MSNSHYIKGRAFEYKIMEKFRREGAKYVLRSAGSHGVVDVLGVWKNRIVMAQCKKGCEVTKAEIKELDKLQDLLSGPVTVHVIYIDDSTRGVE